MKGKPINEHQVYQRPDYETARQQQSTYRTHAIFISKRDKYL